MVHTSQQIVQKKILIVSASRVQKGQISETPIYKSIKYINDQVELIVIPENTNGLPDVYNGFISNEYSKSHDIIAFVHDDVSIEDSMFSHKLYEALQSRNIVGVAGTSDITISKPALWHKMSPDESNWSGAVAHPFEGGIRMTHFGTSPKDCIVLDGVFIAARISDLIAHKLKFDNQFSFHHYDLDFCIQAHKKGLKITTWPIWLYHSSPGLASIKNPMFQASEKKFINKYI